jgi:sulfur carrier protein ThiS
MDKNINSMVRIDLVGHFSAHAENPSFEMPYQDGLTVDDAIAHTGVRKAEPFFVTVNGKIRDREDWKSPLEPATKICIIRVIGGG